MEQTCLTEKTLATERKYKGKIISVDLLDIELPDGRKAKREVIRHGNAVAIRNGTIFDSKTLSAWLCWKIAK